MVEALRTGRGWGRIGGDGGEVEKNDVYILFPYSFYLSIYKF